MRTKAIIRANLDAVGRRIAAACEGCSPARDPGGITLVAVSKRQPAASIAAARACGLRDFGENYVQEAQDKAQDALLADPGIRWHLIGPLQSNKTGAAARLFSWVHSLDRLRIARRLGQARVDEGAEPLLACLQVNLGGEGSKSGVPASEAEGFARECRQIAGIQLRGLMCIPEAGLDRDRIRGRFGELAGLLADCRRAAPELDTLSMGMSADYPEAIEAGATMLRLGTVLFGARPA